MGVGRESKRRLEVKREVGVIGMPLREGQNLGQRGQAQLPYKQEHKLRSKVGIWRGEGAPQIGKSMEPRQLVCSDTMERGERRLERIDLAGPSRPPDLIPRAKDPDRDFKQDIIWRLCGEWVGEGQELLLKLQHQHLGHSGSPGTRALVMLLQRHNEAASGELGDLRAS